MRMQSLNHQSPQEPGIYSTSSHRSSSICWCLGYCLGVVGVYAFSVGLFTEAVTAACEND